MAARRFRDPIDPKADFYSRRKMTCCGVNYGPGDPFDKTSVTWRRLQVLFNGRAIAMVGEDGKTINLPQAPRRFGRWAQSGAPMRQPNISYSDDGDLDFSSADAAAMTSPDAPIPDDWRTMKWFALKAFTKSVTGIEPKNKEEAVPLVEAEIERRATLS